MRDKYAFRNLVLWVPRGSDRYIAGWYQEKTHLLAVVWDGLLCPLLLAPLRAWIDVHSAT